MAALRRGAPERALAWVYTGPLGHLYGAVADITELWTRWMLQRALKRRSMFSNSRFSDSY